MPGFIEWLDTPAGPVPRISCDLRIGDHLGACMARWGIGRMEYIVPAGLYAVGHPSADDPVLVTANYKMSYDAVRHALSGRHAWLLVLETYGINVWCAAGKGTFGTGEVVRRVTGSGLARVVTHRNLILPILGAPGVAAHQVLRRCGFTVRYAAIRAADIPGYLDNGMLTTPAMRELTFTLYERMVLVPVEVVLAARSLVVASAVVMLACGVTTGFSAGMTAFAAYAGAVLTGIVAAPLLLPWLPGRSFAVKGALAGLLWTVCFRMLTGASGWSALSTVAALLVLPAVSAFYTLNFTGCSTFTSRSGVRKEMRLGLPVMGGAAALGLILLILGRFA